MPQSIRKIWLYLLPLALLGLLAYYGGEFDIKNPFGGSEPDLEIAGDSTLASDSVLAAIDQGAPNDSMKVDDAESLIENQQSDNPKQWRLVIGSLREKIRAEKLLAQSDNPSGSIMYIDRLATYRVVYGSYEDIKAAQLEIPGIQERFSDAWLVYF